MANATGFRYTKVFTDETKNNADFCPHVSRRKLKHAVGFFYENDSMGPVSQYVVCENCRVKGEEEIDNTEEICWDCRKPVLTKDTIQWTPYDFYAPQGDEPLIICHECRKLPTHLERVERDRRDHDAEFPEMGDDDYDDDDFDDEDEPDDNQFIDVDDLEEEEDQ